MLNMFLEKLSKLSSMGVLGGWGQQATYLVAKHAVEFPQILANNSYFHDHMVLFSYCNTNNNILLKYSRSQNKVPVQFP